METMNEISKQIDGVYKNLFQNYHPQTTAILNSAKAYLKALHASTAAFSIYVETMATFSKSISKANQEHGKEFETIATRLSNLHREQLAFLKQFYIEFILPVENNSERDLKVVQQHYRDYVSKRNLTLESFKKALSTVKKIKKKRTKNHGNLDKEIRGLQAYQEECFRVEEFFEQSLKFAKGEELGRFGFFWNVQEGLFPVAMEIGKLGSVESGSEETLNLNNGDEDVFTQPPPAPPPLPPVVVTPAPPTMSPPHPPPHPPPAHPQETLKKILPALHAYKNDDEDDGFHQLLNFEQGDLVAMTGPASPTGWQFGENLRTQKSGWFPASFIELPSNHYATLENIPLPDYDDDDDENFDKDFFGSYGDICNPVTMETKPSLSRSASFASSTMTSVTMTNNKRPKLFTKLIKRTMSFVTMGKSDSIYLENNRLPWEQEDEFRFKSLNNRDLKGRMTFGGEVGGGKGRSRAKWDDLWGEDYYFHGSKSVQGR